MAAPVKTKARSITKADIEYSYEANRKWPYTQNIIDIIRCSVCFDNIKDLIDGVEKFHNVTFNRNNCCISKILRVKNGFLNFEDESWNIDNLSQFNYADVKLNVLIEYNDIHVIGEIQFILSFMLKAKKMGHSVYSFNRKKELYDKLYDICDNDKNIYNDNTIDRILRSIILTRNMFRLSLFCQTMNKYEKEYISKNYKMLDKMMKDNDWNKGRKLLTIVNKE